MQVKVFISYVRADDEAFAKKHYQDLTSDCLTSGGIGNPSIQFSFLH